MAIPPTQGDELAELSAAEVARLAEALSRWTDGVTLGDAADTVVRLHRELERASAALKERRSHLGSGVYEQTFGWPMTQEAVEQSESLAAGIEQQIKLLEEYRDGGDHPAIAPHHVGILELRRVVSIEALFSLPVLAWVFDHGTSFRTLTERIAAAQHPDQFAAADRAIVLDSIQVFRETAGGLQAAWDDGCTRGVASSDRSPRFRSLALTIRNIALAGTDAEVERPDDSSESLGGFFAYTSRIARRSEPPEPTPAKKPIGLRKQRITQLPVEEVRVEIALIAEEIRVQGEKLRRERLGGRLWKLFSKRIARAATEWLVTNDPKPDGSVPAGVLRVKAEGAYGTDLRSLWKEFVGPGCPLSGAGEKWHYWVAFRVRVSDED